MIKLTDIQAVRGSINNILSISKASNTHTLKKLLPQGAVIDNKTYLSLDQDMRQSYLMVIRELGTTDNTMFTLNVASSSSMYKILTSLNLYKVNTPKSRMPKPSIKNIKDFISIVNIKNPRDIVTLYELCNMLALRYTRQSLYKSDIELLNMCRRFNIGK